MKVRGLDGTLEEGSSKRRRERTGPGCACAYDRRRPRLECPCIRVNNASAAADGSVVNPLDVVSPHPHLPRTMGQNRIFVRMRKRKRRGRSRRYLTVAMPCSVIFLRRLRVIWLLPPPPPLRTRQTASNHCNLHQRKLLFSVYLTQPLSQNIAYFFLGFVF